MNKLQNIFSSLTGFEASYKPRGAEKGNWETWTEDQLKNVICNLGLPKINDAEAEKLFTAMTAFLECKQEGADLDVIFSKLAN